MFNLENGMKNIFCFNIYKTFSLSVVELQRLKNLKSNFSIVKFTLFYIQEYIFEKIECL